MIKKQLFYLFYIFCSFTLLVCGEKNLLPNLTNSQEPEPGVFGSLEPEPEPLGKKIKSRSRLKKKLGAGAEKEIAGSPALVMGKSATLCI